MEHLRAGGIELEELASERRLIRALRSISESVAENQNILPLVGAALGLLLALVVGHGELPPGSPPWTIEVIEARTGFISALSIVFAGLSIVLALASVTTQNVVGRFSLRLLTIYQRNPADKIVIGIFALTGTFILVEWFQLRSLPPTSIAPPGGVVMGMFLLLVTGAMIIWYIGAMLNWLRVDRILDRVSRLTIHAAITSNRELGESLAVSESVFARPSDAIPLRAERSGHLSYVDLEGLSELADKFDVNIVVDRSTGQSVIRGDSIGWIAKNEEASNSLPSPKQIASMIDITHLREVNRSISYGFIVLVDIALMALSSSGKDSNTAAQVVTQMTYLLHELKRLRLGSVGLQARQGQALVAARASTFGDYIKLATAQILMRCGEDPMVIRALVRLQRALESMELSGPDKEAVEDFAREVRKLESLSTAWLTSVPG